MNKLIAILFFVSSFAFAQQPKHTEVFLADKPAPTVVLAHACGGIVSHIINQAREYQRWGYNAIVVDSYTPRGYYNCFGPQRVVHPSDRKYELIEAARWAKSQSWHRGGVALVGWSHGATAALSISNDSDIKEFDVIAAYYPACNMPGVRYTSPNRPTVVFLGGQDTWTPSSYCERAVKPFFNPTSQLYKLKLYPNATHVFDDPMIYDMHGYKMRHDPDATMDSYQELKQLFKQLQG